MIAMTGPVALNSPAFTGLDHPLNPASTAKHVNIILRIEDNLIQYCGETRSLWLLMIVVKHYVKPYKPLSPSMKNVLCAGVH